MFSNYGLPQQHIDPLAHNNLQTSIANSYDGPFTQEPVIPLHFPNSAQPPQVDSYHNAEYTPINPAHIPHDPQPLHAQAPINALTFYVIGSTNPGHPPPAPVAIPIELSNPSNLPLRITVDYMPPDNLQFPAPSANPVPVAVPHPPSAYPGQSYATNRASHPSAPRIHGQVSTSFRMSPYPPRALSNTHTSLSSLSISADALENPGDSAETGLQVGLQDVEVVSRKGSRGGSRAGSRGGSRKGSRGGSRRGSRGGSRGQGSRAGSPRPTTSAAPVQTPEPLSAQLTHALPQASLMRRDNLIEEFRSQICLISMISGPPYPFPTESKKTSSDALFRAKYKCQLSGEGVVSHCLIYLLISGWKRTSIWILLLSLQP